VTGTKFDIVSGTAIAADSSVPAAAMVPRARELTEVLPAEREDARLRGVPMTNVLGEFETERERLYSVSLTVASTSKSPTVPPLPPELDDTCNVPSEDENGDALDMVSHYGLDNL